MLVTFCVFMGQAWGGSDDAMIAVGDEYVSGGWTCQKYNDGTEWCWKFKTPKPLADRIAVLEEQLAEMRRHYPPPSCIKDLGPITDYQGLFSPPDGAWMIWMDDAAHWVTTKDECK